MVESYSNNKNIRKIIPKNFSLEKARFAQKIIASKCIKNNCFSKIDIIAGVDATYIKNFSIASIACIDFKTHEIIEIKKVYEKTYFPYIPTLLSFREAPLIFKCFHLLNNKPDIIIVNGHGIAHPYKCGLATHVGVILNIPSIGVARKKLYGEEKIIGNKTFLIDENSSIIAEVIKRGKTKLYVSIGNMIDLETSVSIVLSLLNGLNLPLPLQIAHNECENLKNKFKLKIIK
ncbi:MAG: endonuclease V [Nitrososphaerota archaeon]